MVIDDAGSKPPRTALSQAATCRPKPDWEVLRQLSLLPGGFGAERVYLWPQLLHAPPAKPKPMTEKSDIHDESLESLSHRDERQIRLDTERSFVLYPVGIAKDKDILQAQLHELLVSIFRKRPRLSYFQGYHDIITVLFLTLPEEEQLACAEKLSLQRVRDSMGASLEPILGLLRVMKNLLRLVDPDFASLLERNSPLPFYALSNLLTLFSHDMPSLTLIQHVFDYLLCRPPIMVVYLATVIILSRKQEVERLEAEGEEGMVHSLLSGLPDISDEEAPFLIKAEEPSTQVETDTGDTSTEKDPGDTKPEEVRDEYEPLENEEVKQESSPIDVSPTTLEVNPTPIKRESVDPVETANLLLDDSSTTDSHLEVPPQMETPSEPPLDAKDEKVEEEEQVPFRPSPPAHPQRPKVSLTSLLSHADSLYKSFPPTHPSVSLSSIMGPQSVVFTWSESKSEMPSDADAEKMVDKPELVVRPYIEPEEQDTQVPDKGKKHRKRRKLRKPRFARMEKRTMVAGAVLVLGVAMAVYGIRARAPGSGSDGHGHTKDWRKLSGWVGGALVGTGERILHGFGKG